MKRLSCCLGLSVLLVMSLFPADVEPLTVVEKTEYARTSLYSEVIEFLNTLQARSANIEMTSLGDSHEGRQIPLLIVSAAGIQDAYQMRRQGLPAVLIMANIHAGEVEGKEAVQMLLRDFAFGRHQEWLENQVILFLPIFNPDGNDQLGKNRRDNGPELAGVRHNGQHLDLNRDYIKLESPEVNALVGLFREWDPVLVVDLHTTNGSYHRHPVTYSTLANANSPLELRDYMWQEFFPRVGRELREKYGFTSIPYGNFVDRADPLKGWANDAFDARFGSNYVGLRNRFTVLDENYSYTDFRTRVLSCLAFLKSILAYTWEHIDEMSALVNEADRKTTEFFHRGSFAVSHRVEKLLEVEIDSYEFTRERIPKAERHKYPAWYGDFLVRRTERETQYRVPYMARAVPGKTVNLPHGYLLAAHQPEIIAKLRDHGVVVHELLEPCEEEVEVFKLASVEMASSIFQGRVLLTVRGDYRQEKLAFPAGAFYVSLAQPLARLAAVMLEPENNDSLASWGFFNRVLVRQWSAQPGVYPVYRVLKKPLVPMTQVH